MSYVLALFVILLFNNCKKRDVYDFKKEVVKRMELGTDSTKEWLYIKDGIFIDTDMVVDGKIYQMTTSTGGNTYMFTVFTYSKKSNYNNVEDITTKFIIDSIGDKYGHHYDFVINEYSWYIGKESYASYICKFDSLGNILQEEGSIYVDGYKYKKNKTRDVLFTTAFHTIDSVIIYSPTLERKKYKPQPYSWQPMMEYVSMDYSLDSIFYIETYATRMKDSFKQIYYDTFFSE